MSYDRKDKPYRTGLGAAEERRNISYDRLPREGNRGDTTPTHAQVQSHTSVTPHVKLRVKQFRISHLNCNRSRMALDELILVRSRDDALLITEPNLSDGTPPDKEGYILISSQGPETRACIYIREHSMKYTSEHVSTHLTTSMRVGTRLIRCVYDPPRGTENCNPNVYDDMEEGEIRMGDYNVAHPNWMDGNPITNEGARLLEWVKEQEGVTEAGPREGTHELGNKLDLIFT